jgi:hypothetical protein
MERCTECGEYRHKDDMVAFAERWVCTCCHGDLVAEEVRNDAINNRDDRLEELRDEQDKSTPTLSQ